MSSSFRIRWDIGAGFIKDFDRATRRRLGPAAVALSNEWIEECQKIARQELVNNRPEERRNVSAGMPHWISSFKVGAPDLSGGRVRMTVYNTHYDLSKWIEHGTTEHLIRGPGRFPAATMRKHGADYAYYGEPFVPYGGSLPWYVKWKPGPSAGGYKIMERGRAAMIARPHDITMAITLSLAS